MKKMLAGPSLAILILLATVACTTDKGNNNDIQPALRLYVFDCGMIRFESIEAFSIADHETPVRDLVVPCYVIEHENGRLLWDGGLASAIADKKGWQGEGTQLRLERRLEEQLAEIKLSWPVWAKST